MLISKKQSPTLAFSNHSCSFITSFLLHVALQYTHHKYQKVVLPLLLLVSCVNKILNFCDMSSQSNFGNDNHAILSTRLQELGLHPFDVGGAGDCFFRAVSHQYYNTADLHRRVRLCAITHMRDNQDLYSHTVSGLGHEWETYLHRMSMSGTWSDNIIVQAVANSLSIVIYIVHAFHQSPEPIIINPVSQIREQVIVLGFIPEVHYVSTIRQLQASNTVFTENTKLKDLRKKLKQTKGNIVEKNMKRRKAYLQKNEFPNQHISKKKRTYSSKTENSKKQKISTSLSEVQKYYASFDAKTSERLSKQPWAVENLMNFQKSLKFNIYHCTVCLEAWPTSKACRKCTNFVCGRCKDDRKSPKLFSAENGMIPSKVPGELQGLTQTEEMLIARALPVVNIYIKPGGQRGYSGHCINLPQNVFELAKSLPRSAKDLKLIVVKINGNSGSSKSSFVRRSVVLSALLWLIENNPLYKDVNLDNDAVLALPIGAVPDDLKSVETQSNNTEDVESDFNLPDEEKVYDSETEVTSSISIPDKVLHEVDAIDQEISDISNNVSWPSVENEPLNEYSTPFLASMAFPTLFPDAKGDPTNPSVYREVAFPAKVKHLIKFADFVDGKFEYRFASHPRFSYWALNMIQRKRALQQTGIYLKQNPGDAPMSSADIHNLMDTCSAQSNMYKLSRYVGNKLGSNAYWQKQKQDLRTIVSKKGTGTIFFTFSAADLHWEELHALFHKNPSQLSSQERRQNVINNPHLTDWFFVQRLENFIQHWLYKTLNAEWHWYRYEYQARGSVHCHGIAKLKNDPGICHLAESALKGFKAQKQTLQQNNPQHIAQVIEDGISSSAIICSYADWLFSTVNPNPPENGNWVKPTIHPCQHSYIETNSDEDLVNLLNTVQRHTRCSTRYCLKKNAEDDQMQCRFRFPKPLCKETCLQFEKISVKGQTEDNYKMKLVTERNDPRINNYQELQLQGWRANCDIQLILSFRDCIEYITKYAAKGEPRSNAVKESFTAIMKAAPDANSYATCLKKLVMKTLGLRDFSAQETTHHLLSLKLVSSTFQVLPVNLEGSRRLRENIASEDEEITCKSLLDYYAHRNQYQPAQGTEDILSMNFDQFATTYKIVNKKLALQNSNVVPKFYPNYPSTPGGEKYGMYCRYQLIRYGPWSTNIEDAWDNECAENETYIQKWTQFMATDYAKVNVVDWSQQMEIIQQQILEECTGTDSHNSNNFSEPHEQEDWMQLSRLVQNTCNSTNNNTQNICNDWSEDRSSYNSQLLGEMPNWVQQQKNMTAIQEPSIQTNTESFTCMQLLAYNIVKEHVQQSANSNAMRMWYQTCFLHWILSPAHTMNVPGLLRQSKIVFVSKRTTSSQGIAICL